jgi:dCMP deaminase
MRPSWDKYFGYLCQVVSWRSDDEETKVGSVIVDSKNRIVSVGYNGTPRGTNLPHVRPAKYAYTVHSEPNCIITAQRNVEGCRLYVLGMLPCNDCAKLICQAGLTEVVVVNKVERTAKDWNFDATLEMFRQCQITLREINVPKVKIVKIDFNLNML